MRFFIFSSLVALGVSCGSDKTVDDVKSTYCGGDAAAAGATDVKSCHGAFWTASADKAACEKLVADHEAVKDKAAADFKTLIDDADFSDAAKATATCAKVGILPAA